MVQQILFDYDRMVRVGLPEAVFCSGKSLDALVDLLSRFASDSAHPILFTRLTQVIFDQVPEQIRIQYDYHPLSLTAFSCTLPQKKKGKVAVVSAGTADGFATWEAKRTLTYLGIQTELFEDCGVAGLWRLMDRLDAINTADVVIVIAGLDAALISVLGGLTAKPIFGVPTSVGYGMAANGKTALASMLSSCAPGVGILNIDNGYGAACAAARIINTLQ